MSSINKKFSPFFPPLNFVAFYSFIFFFIALTRTLSTMLRNGESRHSCLVLKLSAVWEISCRLLINAINQVKEVPFIPSLLKLVVVFYSYDHCVLLSSFSAYIEMIM